MIVKEQKNIEFINDCNAIVDYKELECAIIWYSDKPTTSKKHIYLHGNYPAISIYNEKIHIHRLLMMYWLGTKIPTEFSVHHINENKLDARKENLSVIHSSSHNSNHNKGKSITPKMRERIIRFNHSRKGTRQKNKRKDVSYENVKILLEKGYSINRIAKELNCSWDVIKSRQKDIFDNPELLKGE